MGSRVEAGGRVESGILGAFGSEDRGVIEIGMHGESIRSWARELHRQAVLRSVLEADAALQTSHMYVVSLHGREEASQAPGQAWAPEQTKKTASGLPTVFWIR